MENFTDLLPFLIPLVILQFGLLIAAWVHIFKSENYRFGNRMLWLLVSLITIVGPVIYFFVGREEH